MRPVRRFVVIWVCFLLVSAFVCAVSRGMAAEPNERPGDLKLTVVYDNNPYDARLQTRWGFSCYVKGAEKTILFDVGGDGTVLLSNMERLGVDPKTVNAVVLSHIHHDHIGGLSHFLEVNPRVTVFMPQSLPQSVKERVRLAGANWVGVREPMRICKSVYSTGELGVFIREQALIIETNKGLVLITGCAHPGIVEMVKKAKEQLSAQVYLVLGGFHLCWMNLSQVNTIISGVKKEGVKQVGPSHCSGDLARKQFEKVYGKDFILVGAGRTITIAHALPL
jgi:7,8-dihydropterin-6-yl-methyl-4-(beta-D-ribofuranosyl)aminobenzene 5'-phosphate synthase